MSWRRSSISAPGPQAPVVMLLPDGAVSLQLFLPEPEMARVAPGTRLAVTCDNCPEGIEAEIDHIAEGPEFTPPVIYSLENRQKLVYRVEARLLDGADLKPGQIVEVRLADGPS